MKCNLKTMMSVAAVMAAVAGFAYLTLEEARAGILASLPVLAFLVCPISMLLMMKMMMPSESKAGQCSTGSGQRVLPAADSVHPAKEAS